MNSEIGSIAQSASEQAQGIAEINKAVSQIDQLTKENLAMAEENAKAGTSLGAAANSLIAQVSHFKLAATRASKSEPPVYSLDTSREGAELQSTFTEGNGDHGSTAVAVGQDWAEF